MTDHDYDHPSEPRRAFRRKTTPDDRLSALPDEILLHILSFFCTKDAARTSVLSTRWRDLFIWLPDVDLTFSEAYTCNFMDKRRTLCCHALNKRDMLLCKSIKFINFANRVIMLRKGAPIRKLKLFLASVIPGNSVTIDSLIFAALSCTLQEVGIFIYSDKNWKLARAGLFSCKTLVTLKVIGGEVDLVLPDSVYLPNLKALHLLELAPVDAQSITRLINACPLLEELELGVESHNLSKRLLTRAVDLSSPSLKKLILSGRLAGCSYVIESKNLEYLEYRARQTQQISLDAPNVKYLIYSSLDSINLIQNLKSLVEAKIRVHCSSYPTERGFSLNDLHAFVNGLESVKSLYLYHSSLQALYLCRELLPTFKNLTDLSLDPSNDLFLTNYDHTCLWKVLPSLLKNAPNLEVLIFDQVFRNSFSASEKFECVLPEAIPICSVHHLKEMEIKKFNGEEHEFELVRYFLKNGISLTKMTLCGVVKPSSECCRRILSFWKCSEDCQILFKELDSNRGFDDCLYDRVIISC